MRIRDSLLLVLSVCVIIGPFWIGPLWADEVIEKELATASKAALESRVKASQNKLSKPPKQVIKRQLRTNLEKPQAIPRK